MKDSLKLVKRHYEVLHQEAMRQAKDAETQIEALKAKKNMAMDWALQFAAHIDQINLELKQ
jgi:hypothetical protein